LIQVFGVVVDRFTYTYDGSHNDTEDLYQTWNGSDWVNVYRYAYTFDGSGHETEEVDQSWNGTSWGNDYRYVWVYDGSGHLTQSTDQTWDGSAWSNGDQTLYTYDGNGNRTVEVDQTWNGTAWMNTHRYTTTWQQVVSAVHEGNNAPGTFRLSANYPNPFNPETRIYFSIPTEEYVSLTVHDIIGRQVATLVGERKVRGDYSVTWKADGQPTGVYFYRITAGGQVQTRKMVLMR
jgi:hypothetical protein